MASEQLGQAVLRHYIDTVDMSLVEPMRFMTLAEKLIQRASMVQISGLREDQCAFSAFGFPPVPKVSTMKAPNGKRLRVPRELKDSPFFEHPIFWIDPKLTDFIDDVEREKPERWVVRMYYVMIAMGLLDFEEKPEKWYPALASKDFEVSHSDRSDYFAGEANLDHLVWKEEDLLVPYDTVLTFVAEVNDILDRKVVEEWRAFREQESKAVSTLKRAAGVEKPLREKARAVADMIKGIDTLWKNNEPISNEVSNVHEELGKIEKQVEIIEDAAELVSLINLCRTTDDENELAHVSSLISLSSKDRKATQRVDVIGEVIGDIARATSNDEMKNATDAAAKYVSEVVDDMIDVLTLAWVNYVAAERDEQLFASVEEMKIANVSLQEYVG